jgi:hypothetical protein
VDYSLNSSGLDFGELGHILRPSIDGMLYFHPKGQYDFPPYLALDLEGFPMFEMYWDIDGRRETVYTRPQGNFPDLAPVLGDAFVCRLWARWSTPCPFV